MSCSFYFQGELGRYRKKISFFFRPNWCLLKSCQLSCQKLKIFDCFWTFVSAHFCRPTPRRIFQLLFGILKALCEISTGAGNFVPGFFCPLSAVSIQFFECFFFRFFSKFAGNRSHSFCIASDGKLFSICSKCKLHFFVLFYTIVRLLNFVGLVPTMFFMEIRFFF